MSDDTDPSPRLPIEVIEQVIDSVYELWYEGTVFRDLYTIWKACALTCRAMSHRSQFWLFRDVVLTTAQQALSLKVLLRANAAVASYVRILTLSGPENDEDKRPYTWISWVPLALAPLMKNLQELQLEWDIFRDCHPGLPRALTAFRSIRRLNISKVSFSSFGHCIGLIRAFPHLRHLAYIGSSWRLNPSNSQVWRSVIRKPSPHKPVQLAHLDLVGVENPRPLSKWLLEVGATKSLVTFYGHLIQYRSIRGIAFSSGSSIRSLALYATSDFPFQLSDHALDSLQTFHFLMSSNTITVPFLMAILVSASHQLRELNIYVPVDDGEDREEPTLTEEELVAYNELDAALCKPVLSGMSLIMCLHGEGVSSEAIGQWQRKLAGGLPKFCSRKGRLIVKRTPLTYPLLRWWKERDGFSLID